jgi:hypothetical protein
MPKHKMNRDQKHELANRLFKFVADLLEEWKTSDKPDVWAGVSTANVRDQLWSWFRYVPNASDFWYHQLSHFGHDDDFDDDDGQDAVAEVDDTEDEDEDDERYN